MSIEALNWAFNLELPGPGQKLVLLALANYADEEGNAFPSQKALSAKTCLGERAIRDNLTRLEELGVIRRTPRARSDGTYTTDLFRLNIGWKPNQEKTTGSAPSALADSEIPAADSADGRNCRIQRQILPNPAADSAGHESSLNTTITKNTRTAPAERALLLQRGIPQKLAEAWLRVRKAKRLALTEHALDLVQREAEKAGITLEDAVTRCCEKGWGGFEASWVKPGNAKAHQAQGAPPWWSSDTSVIAKGREIGLNPRPGESMGEFKGRVSAKLAESVSG